MLKRFAINAYETRLQRQIKQKFAKKGLLIKVFDSNKKQSDSLIQILKESNDLNTLNNANKSENPSSKSRIKTEDEYLSKFRNVSKGGPNHSIAISRAHHLTNFLSEYIINAFQSSHFDSPEIPDELNTQTDLNGFKKEKFSFEISNVELMSDLSALKIYWLSSDNEKINAVVESFLEKNLKSQIRNTLTSERVMNYVPKIVFLRDESRVLMSQLDDYLMKINLENKTYNSNDQSENSDSNEKSEQNIENSSTKKNLMVNNLYGINFNNLVDSIKKGGSSDLTIWTQSDSIPEPCVEKNSPSIKSKQELNNNFEASLKAYEINKRTKRERLNKSALLKIAQMEFAELKEKNFQ